MILPAIKERLRKICDDSGIKADDDVLFWIAKEATGSLRDSYTLFDKIAAFSGSEISLALIKEKMGLVGFDKINQLAECFVDSSSTRALEILDDILSSGVAVEQFVTEPDTQAALFTGDRATVAHDVQVAEKVINAGCDILLIPTDLNGPDAARYYDDYMAG